MSLYEKLSEKLLSSTQKSIDTTHNTADVFKTGLENTVKQINRGFQLTMYMYLCVFIVGVLMLGFSVYMAITTEKEFISVMFGGMGLASVLSFFFSKTLIELQRSRAELAQVQAALFSWFIDLTNWNSLLLRKQNITVKDMKVVSDEQISKTEQTVKMISTYVQNKPNKKINKD